MLPESVGVGVDDDGEGSWQIAKSTARHSVDQSGSGVLSLLLGSNLLFYDDHKYRHHYRTLISDCSHCRLIYRRPGGMAEKDSAETAHQRLGCRNPVRTRYEHFEQT
jgi:hypothetical protein